MMSHYRVAPKKKRAWCLLCGFENNCDLLLSNSFHINRNLIIPTSIVSLRRTNRVALSDSATIERNTYLMRNMKEPTPLRIGGMLRKSRLHQEMRRAFSRQQILMAIRLKPWRYTGFYFLDAGHNSMAGIGKLTCALRIWWRKGSSWTLLADRTSGIRTIQGFFSTLKSSKILIFEEVSARSRVSSRRSGLGSI